MTRECVVMLGKLSGTLLKLAQATDRRTQSVRRIARVVRARGSPQCAKLLENNADGFRNQAEMMDRISMLMEEISERLS